MGEPLFSMDKQGDTAYHESCKGGRVAIFQHCQSKEARWAGAEHKGLSERTEGGPCGNPFWLFI